jgi:hypothetical protein
MWWCSAVQERPASVKSSGGDTRKTRWLAVRPRAGRLPAAWRCQFGMAISAFFLAFFPRYGDVAEAQFAPVPSGSNSPVDIPRTNLTPVPRTTAPPTVPQGGALFDPYTVGPSAGTFAPAVPGVAPAAPNASFPGWLPSTQPPPSMFSAPSIYAAPPQAFGSGNPGFNTQPLGQTMYGQSSLGPPMYSQPQTFGQPGFGTTVLPPTGFPPEAYPSSAPTTLFPGGLLGPGIFAGSAGGSMGAFRLMQGPKLRHGWLRGGDGDKSLDMNETDVAVSFAFPNFCHTGQPIYITPAFGLTLLSGPHSNTGADLPGQVYSGTLTADWQSDPVQIFSIDLGLTVGMFSDFDTNISDSFRVLGRGLAHFRLTPFTTLKGGVHVINRNRYTVLPAFGLLYTPTPMTRYDLFFPEPKLAHYFTTLGTQDIWAYIGGEYGGGSWTVQRQSGVTEQVDINDIRITMGFEWGRSDLLRQGRRTGFAEIGYVFDRELVYKSRVGNMDPNDTFMIRAGIGY